MLCSLLKEDLKSSKLIWMHQIGQIIFSQKKEKCQDKHCTASGKKQQQQKKLPPITNLLCKFVKNGKVNHVHTLSFL